LEENILEEIWCERINSEDPETSQKIKEIAEECNIPLPVAKIAVARGCQNGFDTMTYLDPSVEDFHSPWELPDMQKAVQRILQAKEHQEKVCIYGDYDVDGIMAVSILIDYLRTLKMNVCYKIPNRLTEGYGMNMAAVETLGEEGVQLIVTVDNGIASKQEIQSAIEKGMDVIVTDHHECQGDLPNAAAVIDPKRLDSDYPFRELCGAGIAFKLVQALEETQQRTNDLRKYLECAAVATVADIVPLQNENRLIVKLGIDSMNEGCQNLGLKALIHVSEIETVTSGNIGFVIAPKINAAGRLGEAQYGVELFIGENLKIAEWLKNENIKRQEIEQKIYNKAIRLIKEQQKNKQVFICVAGENWHPGVIGIVASKIQEIWYHPVIVMGIDQNGIARGSCRSVEGINIFETLSACSELFETYGGHAMAAGFSIKKENIQALEKFLIKKSEEDHLKQFLIKKVYYDSVLSEDEINWELMDCVRMCEPYGVNNPSPIFRLNHVHPTEIKTMGKENNHLCFKDNNFRCIAFSKAKWRTSLSREYTNGIDLLVVPKINHFAGKESIELMVKSVRLPFLFDHQRCWHAVQIIKSETSEETLKELDIWKYDKEDLLPNRNEMVWVYKVLKQFSERGVRFDDLIDKGPSLNCFKLLLILEVFNELKIVNCRVKKGMIFSKIPSDHQKKDINQSKLVIKLKRNIF
jgi:single-stranded-DNA-specific exonuclease